MNIISVLPCHFSRWEKDAQRSERKGAEEPDPGCPTRLFGPLSLMPTPPAGKDFGPGRVREMDLRGGQPPGISDPSIS